MGDGIFSKTKLDDEQLSNMGELRLCNCSSPSIEVLLDVQIGLVVSEVVSLILTLYKHRFDHYQSIPKEKRSFDIARQAYAEMIVYQGLARGLVKQLLNEKLEITLSDSQKADIDYLLLVDELKEGEPDVLNILDSNGKHSIE